MLTYSSSVLLRFLGIPQDAESAFSVMEFIVWYPCLLNEGFVDGGGILTPVLLVPDIWKPVKPKPLGLLPPPRW